MRITSRQFEKAQCIRDNLSIEEIRTFSLHRGPDIESLLAPVEDLEPIQLLRLLEMRRVLREIFEREHIETPDERALLVRLVILGKSEIFHSFKYLPDPVEIDDTPKPDDPGTSVLS